MNARGFAYILALMCLVFVSTTALVWQKQHVRDSVQVTHAWAGILADQAALSGIEYSLALAKQGKLPSKSLVIPVPGGSCNLSFTRKSGILTIRAESQILNGGRVEKAARVVSVQI